MLTHGFHEFCAQVNLHVVLSHHVLSELQQVINEIGWSLFKVSLSKNTSIINVLMSFPSGASI